MTDASGWHKEQLKPLSMFELAKWWADAIKVIGAGNGTGLIAAGAALGPFQDHHHSLFFVKLAGAAFFVGVFGFAVAFAMLHRAMFAQDEMSQALLRKDEPAIGVGAFWQFDEAGQLVGACRSAVVLFRSYRLTPRNYFLLVPF
jgi:hypothetical protein